MVIAATVAVAPGAAVVPLAIPARPCRTGIALANRTAIVVASATAAAAATPATASAAPGTAIVVPMLGVCGIAVALTARLASTLTSSFITHLATRCIDGTIIVEACRTVALDPARPVVVAATTAVVV